MMGKPSPGGAAGALIFTAGMVIFGLCAHRGELWSPRAAGLLLAVLGVAMAFAQSPRRPAGHGDLLRLRLGRPRNLGYLPVCIAFGITLAMLYRYEQDRAVFPAGVTLFVFVAAVIGLCEELAFRGMVQSGLRGWGMWSACIGAAVAHTAYKCSLFMLPAGPQRANLIYLAVGTLVVGTVFGLMRERLGSVWFPVSAHVTFDILSYADMSAVPWWVG